MLYRLLLYLHISSVIFSVGPYVTWIPFVRKLKTASEERRLAYLETFRFTVRLTKHAGHVLVGTGIMLVLVGHWAWTTTWIAMTIILMAASLVFLARAFSPSIRKLSEPGPVQSKPLGKLQRSMWIYLILLLTMLLFMVFQPNWW